MIGLKILNEIYKPWTESKIHTHNTHITHTPAMMMEKNTIKTSPTDISSSNTNVLPYQNPNPYVPAPHVSLCVNVVSV